MRILPAVEEEIRRGVRARAKDPLIRVAGLKAILENHFKRGFSHQYVSKIANKVACEGLIEIDRTQIEERMQFTRENYRMMRERLLKVVYWTKETGTPGMKPPLHSEIVDAAKTIVMLDMALLKAELETGMYKKPVEGREGYSLRAAAGGSAGGCHCGTAAWRTASNSSYPADVPAGYG